MFNIPVILTDKERQIENKIKTYYNKKENCRGRLIPCPQLNANINSLSSHEFNVFMQSKTAPLTWRKCDSFQELLLCSLSMINNSNNKEVYVRVFLIEETPDELLLINNIFVNEKLLRILKCDTGTSVLLKPLLRKEISNEIEVHSNNNRKDMKYNLQSYLADKCKHHEVIFNSDIPLELENNIICSLKFKPNFAKYCCVDQEFLRTCRYSFVDDHVQKLPPYETNANIDFIETFNNRDILKDIMQNVENNLRKNRQLGCYLITGNYFIL